MSRMKYIFFSVFAFTAATLSMKAQAVYAQVSSKHVQVGEAFEYAVVASVNINNITPPDFKGFAVIGGPFQSSSTQYVNGQTTSQLTVTWQLAAQKEGKYTLGRSIATGSQRYETNSITIEVTKGPAGADGKGTGSNDVFIRTNVSRNKCYIGEQITVTQKIYSRRLQIVGYRNFAQPSYDGFYSIAQESASKGQVTQENVDGETFYTYEMFRTVAIANKAGKISLNPIEGEVVVRRMANSKPRNMFEQFFGANNFEDIPVTLKSRSAVVEILPLPEAGKPADFSGAVGSFAYKVSASRNELRANDAFNLKLTITGSGNMKLISAPKLKLPESFEVYDPKITENGNSRTFDYLVIPRSEGTYSLEELDFTYFDPSVHKYVTLKSGDVTIKVQPPDPNSSEARVYTPHSNIKETENDIRYIKKGNFNLSVSEKEFFNSFSHIALLFVPVLGLAGGLVVRRRQHALNSNVALVRERKAGKVARKRLQNAEKLKNANDKEAFYAEILAALYSYLGHKMNIPSSDLGRERLRKELSLRGVDEALHSKLFLTLDNAEYARYAPGAVSGDLRQVYEDTVALVTSLEEQLGKKA